MTRTTLRLSGLAVFSVVAAAASASSTIATFADPSQSSANPLFTFTSTGSGLQGVLSGGWSGSGLTLTTPGFIGGGSSSNVHFTMTNLNISATGVATAAGGGNALVHFTDSSNATLFDVSFGSGTMNPFSLGGSTLFGNNVTFAGPHVPAGLSQQFFAFSFANQNANGNTTTYTSSFTSSAAVPEPASMAALGLGVLAMIRRKRAR